MKTDKALIFDFNGTLFWDTSYNREAWDFIALKYRGKIFSDAEMHMLNGRTNIETIPYLFGGFCDQEIVNRISREKEDVYRAICEKQAPLSLAPGAETLFKEAMQQGIPLAIATSACPDNMDAYKKWFALSRYFDDEYIITDNGIRKGKPEPDIYLDTCKALNREPSTCIVFEDTRSGILSATKAGIREIYAIASNGADIQTTKAMEHVHGLLSDFRQFSL
ncbi:HAD family phosphatase [uncultured Sphaerochaeta sp.]|uniref:HAD family hydrolase n=1 Tax=uncultured Sphaerochaeta sp. TaxID=886478 RepID=UPI002A0A1E81|nr:HAD family phosphatase [uncultured Sphaerochaeta sp.]